MLTCGACRKVLPFGVELCPNCGATVGGAAMAAARAIHLFSNLKYGEAAREFDEARLLAPHDLDILRGLAHAQYHSGAVDLALDLYRALLQENPDDFACEFNLGRILIVRDRLDQAKAIFERLVHTDAHPEPDIFYLGFFYRNSAQVKADCFHYLALIRWNQGDTKAAKTYFERALELNPNHAQAFHYLGNLYFQTKKYAEAAHSYSRYLELLRSPGGSADQQIDANYKLGVSNFELGNLDAATEQFKNVLADHPGHPGAIYHMNLIYQRGGIYSPENYSAPPAYEEAEVASTTFGLSKPKPFLRDSAIKGGGEARPIVGKSILMQRVLRSARLAAASDSTVLITGENGTGKELIARAIHANSSRRSMPFAPVHCAALSETLLESELFGHERGSFTGAVTRKIGRFEAADRGSIFLDEIGDLSATIQVKILRFLQERQFNRVGGTDTISVDVRIIAATNANLEKLLSSGDFREDLYFRLNVVPIRVPPLRERPEDIPLLVDHFVGKYSKAFKQNLTIPPEEMKILLDYEWPGNVRELENIIERAMVMGTQVGQILQGILYQRNKDRMAAVSSTPAARSARERGERDGRSDTPVSGGSSGSWAPVSLEDLERGHIIQTLRHTAGNRTRAAQILGINPTTLWRKMKTYGIAES